MEKIVVHSLWLNWKYLGEILHTQKQFGLEIQNDFEICTGSLQSSHIMIPTR